MGAVVSVVGALDGDNVVVVPDEGAVVLLGATVVVRDVGVLVVATVGAAETVGANVVGAAVGLKTQVVKLSRSAPGLHSQNNPLV